MTQIFTDPAPSRDMTKINTFLSFVNAVTRRRVSYCCERNYIAAVRSKADKSNTRTGQWLRRTPPRSTYRLHVLGREAIANITSCHIFSIKEVQCSAYCRFPTEALRQGFVDLTLLSCRTHTLQSGCSGFQMYQNSLSSRQHR